MCLGIPAKVLSLSESNSVMLSGFVDFGGVEKEVNLSFTPEVKVGEYVIIHVGFSISIIDEKEALEVLSVLESLEEEL